MWEEDLRQVRAVFDEVCELSGTDRQQYLTAHYTQNPALRHRVEQLFAHEIAAADFMEAPVLTGLDALFLRPENEANEAFAGSQLGPYRLERELGRGGMGVVYLAVRDDDVFRKQVAIKLVWPGLSQMVERFRQERQMLADLEHPNIARLLDGGTTAQGWQYLVMEYVEGRSLTEYCQQNNLSVRARLELFLSICAAVQHAHQHLIIHRDLKPGNILVTAAGEVKLLDFGIAKALDTSAYSSDLSLPGTHLMTPEYASPEQLTGDPVTTASDVYSLGVVLFELLTGQRPFSFPSRRPHEVIRVLSQHELPRLSQIAGTKEAKSLRGDLDNIVARALQRQPNDRYASVAQFSEDLRHHLNGEVVQARKPTFTYRFGRFVRRHNVAFSAAAAAFLVLLLWLTFLLRQVQVERAQVREQRRQLYAAEMKQSLAAWQNNDLVQMQKTLERWQPQANEEDLRGFEWRYLQRLINASALTIKLPAVAINAALNVDANQLVVVLDNQMVKIFDTRSGQELRSFPGREAKWGHNQLDAPSKLLRLFDQRKIITYDLLTGSQKAEITDLEGGIRSYFLFNEPGRSSRLISANEKGTIKMCDTATGTVLYEFPGQGKPLTAYWLSDNFEKLLTVTDDKTVRVYFLNRRDQSLEFTEPEVIRHISFAAGFQHLLVLTDKALTVRDIATGRVVSSYAQGAIRIATIAPPTRSPIFAAGNAEGTIGIWTRSPLKRQALLKGHSREVTWLGFTEEPRYLLSTSLDRTTRLWDPQTQQEIAVLRGHTGDITVQDFNPKSGKFVTASQDRTVRIWDLNEVTKPSLLTGHTDHILTVAYAPDGRHVASAGRDRTAIIHDANTGQQIVLRGHQKMIYTVRFSPDGKWLATASDDGTVKLWDVATGRELKTFIKGKREYWDGMRSLAFLPDGHTLLLGGNDGTIILWDVVTGQVQSQFKAHTREILSLSLSPDGKLLASGCYDGSFKLWDTKTWQQKAVNTDHRGKVWSAVFSPDGTQLATSGEDQTIKLWDVATLRLLRTLEGHNNEIFQLAFTPDGKRLASASNDQTVKLWNPNTGQELLTLRDHTNEVWGVAFAPDGKTMLTGSWDKTLRLWRAVVPLM